MLVSCVCPTYGRCPQDQRLLEEAVESFIQQDYRDKELIILNDCPQQSLQCDVPGVRVVNWPSRFSSLGAKLNLLVGLAGGELIAPWDDDDVSLPWRLSQAVRHLGPAHYWKPGRLYYWERGKRPVIDHGGVCHNASIYRKEAWLKAGCYPLTSGGQDMAFDTALRQLGPTPPPLGSDERPAYIYRWGVSPYHLSGNPDPERLYNALRNCQAGTFCLQPKWAQDYVNLILGNP